MIRIEPQKKKRKINPNIYGHFIEHVGRCIYGGIYQDDSFREDVIDVLKKIRVPILRWPGGNFASNYHWEDGIGPKENRPIRFDTAWGELESNRFGTDEFIEFCRKLGAEPYICLNLGTGSLDEAIHWLEYCNRSDTYYGKLRERYGHKEPYRVKYWGIGNEIYGRWQHGHRSSKDYAKVCAEYSHFLKVVDPSIKTVAVGHPEDMEWNLDVLNIAGAEIDYISVHFYGGSDDYYETLNENNRLEKALRNLIGLIEHVEKKMELKNKIEIALDEWNICYRSKPPLHEEDYELKDGLFACGVFHTLHRLSDRVTMANLAQMVNVLGMIRTYEGGILLTPIYRAFELYSNRSYGVVVDSYTDDDFLDVSATLNGDRLVIAVINRNKDKAITSELEISGSGISKECEVYQLVGDGPFDKDVKIIERVEIVSKSFTFPVHSSSILVLRK